MSPDRHLLAARKWRWRGHEARDTPISPQRTQGTQCPWVPSFLAQAAENDYTRPIASLPHPVLPMSDVTRILSAIEQGDPTAAEQLLPLVYDELRRLAAHKLAKEKPGQTLDATALVHEAYLRLVNPQRPQDWANRGHFFA